MNSIKRAPLLLKFGLILLVVLIATGAQAGTDETPEYDLFQNPEGYGLLLFPKGVASSELETFIHSLDFKLVDSGRTAMRFGEKKENLTYMMPRDVQEKHNMTKFIILQVLAGGKGILVGIFEQRYGLTLPPKIFSLDEVEQNIPKTLDLFRAQDGQQKT
ncbi:MAG: hypothetical protein KC553_05455 [Nitrospina sp.]|nr:hypothetical protein [Nitrospina sp.]